MISIWQIAGQKVVICGKNGYSNMQKKRRTLFSVRLLGTCVSENSLEAISKTPKNVILSQKDSFGKRSEAE